MTSDQELEQLLRARLAEVDDVEPPTGTDAFAADALAAGRRLEVARAGRRRAWTRGLLGAAAAVAVFALAVPVFRGLTAGTAGGTASSAVAPEAGAGLQSPADQNDQGSAKDGLPQGNDQPEPQPVPPSLTTPLVPDVPGASPTTYTLGSVPYDWTTQQATDTIRKLRATFPQAVTSMTVDSGTAPPRLVVRMPVLDEAAVARIVAAFPAGAPITVIVG